MYRIIFITISLLLSYINLSYSQATSNLKPKWVNETPHPGNPTYRFHITYVDNANSIEGARMMSKSELYRLVEKSESIKVLEDYHNNSTQIYSGENVSEKTDEIYSMQIYANGEAIDLTYIKLDEYWHESYIGGIRRLEFYTLYAVAKPGIKPQFDEVIFTDKYGLNAMARSLIPGWGQIYKGSVVKGVSILAGEAACIAGIILCENMRASYIKKMKEQPRFAKTYNTKADNWENGRNICIGAAAALYVYNLIDAIATKGARRAVVKKNKQNFTFIPFTDKQNSGLSFVYKF